MKFKFYYLDDTKKCIISDKLDKMPENFENDVIHYPIRIDTDEKNVENLYDFFKEITVFKILNSNYDSIDIDFSSLEEYDFFEEASFKKLRELIVELQNKCNDTIANCLIKESGI